MTDPNKQSGSSPTRKTVPSADFLLENHGSILLLRPQTLSARIWVDDHIGKDNGFQPYYPHAVVIEHRYVEDIITGIQDDGLAIVGVA